MAGAKNPNPLLIGIILPTVNTNFELHARILVQLAIRFSETVTFPQHAIAAQLQPRSTEAGNFYVVNEDGTDADSGVSLIGGQAHTIASVEANRINLKDIWIRFDSGSDAVVHCEVLLA